MKRTGFKRPPMKEATQSTYQPRPRERAVAVAGPARSIVSLPKDTPVRSEAYRRLVAAMPCINCGRAGPSQCAHADEGKGLGIKSDDRTCYPACATAPGRVGCHDLIGASGIATRDERRKIERLYGAKTRATILASGRWPASVPLWSDEI
jgi:hypothetical protein